MGCVFFLYHFNDVDQIAPVVWKLLQRGETATAVMLDPDYDVAIDRRIALLRTYPAFTVMAVDEAIPVPGIAWLFRQRDGATVGAARRALRKLLRLSGLSVGWAAAALRRLGARTCVFEWGGLGARNRTEFLIAAQRLGLRTVCLPHGQSIYLEFHATQGGAVGAAPAPERADYNVYDAYVFQSRYHRDIQVSKGLDGAMCRVLGSARYCPEWQARLVAMHAEFTPAEAPGDRLKVVFMLGHWAYTVERAATMAALDAMADADWIHLVVKDHTRGSGSLPSTERRRLEARDGFQSTASAASTALIAWADAVICFGSSIAIEAVQGGTPLVNPRYLHANRTIFDSCQAGLAADSLDELMEVLAALHRPRPPAVPETARRALLRQTVYGDAEPFDVLAAYADVVLGDAAAARP